MSAAIITRDELIAYGNRAISMEAFTNSQLDEVLERATDRIRQAALNDYTADSFESVTTGNAPDDLRAIALSISLAILTDGDAGRPQSIDDGATDSAKRLGYLAGGKTHYDKSPGSVLVKVADGAGTSVTYRAPTERKFDRNNDSQKYTNRDPEI